MSQVSEWRTRQSRSPPSAGVEDQEDFFLAYLKAFDDGPRAVDELMAAHPERAAEVREFQEDEQEVRRQARPLQEALLGLPSPAAGARCLPLPPPGNYEVIAEIAHGGMGVVWRTWQRQACREEAVKVMLAGEQATPQEQQRFLSEARSAARLEHPNIVRIYEVGISDGQPYFSMELAKGGSLADRADYLRRAPRESARLLRDVARAVEFAHSHRILHRDLKPANILLTGDGTPRVADFGLAKRITTSDVPAPAAVPLDFDADPEDQTASFTVPPDGLTHKGAIVGTLQYMAPEQAWGVTPLTTAVDVYGLGATLYQLLTGRPPFRGETLAETLDQVRNQQPLRPRRLERKVHRDLEAICLKCLRKAPTERYGSASSTGGPSMPERCRHGCG
jgi:eukaryotic-like serine/threonine-protein kinase